MKAAILLDRDEFRREGNLRDVCPDGTPLVRGRALLGNEILHLASDRTMAVSVTVTGDAVSVGKPVPLFRFPADAGGWGANWTSNADHTKYVVVDTPHGSKQTFRVLTNWRR